MVSCSSYKVPPTAQYTLQRDIICNMTEEKREMALREIIIGYTKEYEPHIELADATLEEAMELHQDILNTHYTFTDRDFDMMVLELIQYINTK